jgi:hypothetical protein
LPQLRPDATALWHKGTLLGAREIRRACGHRVLHQQTPDLVDEHRHQQADAKKQEEATYAEQHGQEMQTRTWSAVRRSCDGGSRARQQVVGKATTFR